jgi:RimJ/RimL family protein N-acetyltransferase
MLIELNKREYTKILPLFTEVKQVVIPGAICAGINPGRIFVDRIDYPTSALLTTTVGYYFIAGICSDIMLVESFAKTLCEIVIPESLEMGETGFIIVLPDASWEEYLPVLLPGRKPIRIFRRTFSFDLANLNNVRARIPQHPDNLHVQRIDEVLSTRLDCMKSWASVQDFSKYGIGYCILQGEQIVSSCVSVYASDTHVEIDIHTEENYRRQGLATIVASAFIDECLRRRLEPNWECFWDNEPSHQLAEKLGFVFKEEYPAYYWEERLNEGF